MFANPEPLPGLSSPALLHPAFRPPPANYTLGYTEPSRRAGLSTKGYERVSHPGFIRRVFFSFGRENRIVHHGEHRGHGGSQGSDCLGVLGGAPLQRCSFRAGREAGFSRRGKSVTSGAKAQMKSSLSFARLKLACPERSRRVLHPLTGYSELRAEFLLPGRGRIGCGLGLQVAQQAVECLLVGIVLFPVGEVRDEVFANLSR